MNLHSANLICGKRFGSLSDNVLKMDFYPINYLDFKLKESDSLFKLRPIKFWNLEINLTCTILFPCVANSSPLVAQVEHFCRFIDKFTPHFHRIRLSVVIDSIQVKVHVSTRCVQRRTVQQSSTRHRLRQRKLDAKKKTSRNTNVFSST